MKVSMKIIIWILVILVILVALVLVVFLLSILSHYWYKRTFPKPEKIKWTLEKHCEF